MVTTLVTGTAVRGGIVSPDRIAAVINRNVGALRSGPSYWLVLLSGFFEPLLYLLSIGIGVGALVGDLTLLDGSVVSYAMFVAPAMLATSAMSGAMAETTFNFYFKMKYMRTFDAILATPVRPFEIALGELTWAMMRGSLYAAVFLMIMVAMGLTSVTGALLAFPATILVGFAFGALGMAISSTLRSWQDFDILMTAQFALFLFSGTFAPISQYPMFFEVLIRITPLWHAVEMIRAITLGTVGWATLGHATYLVGMLAVGLFLTGRRLEKVLCK